MRYALFVSLCLFGAAIAQKSNQRADLKKSRREAVVPNRFIIELKDPEGLVKRDNDDGEALFADLAELKVNVSVPLNYTSDVFIGAAVTVEKNTDVEIIEKLPEVEKIWPVYEIPVPKPIDGKAVSGVPEHYNVHHQTGVQRLHDEGVYGEGVTIAVVDTGVDYNHPDLGNGFGPGFKIEGGWDFTGDVWDEINPDNDPFDDCDGHGTHVTGIIAGNGTRFTGVAPASKIRVYKVAICGGSISIDTLIASHIKAYKDGADIISTSIGDTSNWPISIWAKASNKIAQKGVFVVTAAGNSGLNGPFLSNGGAAGKEIISVGASYASQLPALSAIVTDSKGIETEIPYLTYNAEVWKEDWPNPNWETFTPLRTGVKLWSALSPENKNPKNKDGCDELPILDFNDELHNRIVLARLKGNCTVRTMARAAVGRGVWSILLINDNSPPFIPIFTDADPLMQVGLVSEKVGSELERRLVNNETLVIRFPDDGKTLAFENSLGIAVDSYSAWGIANDLSIKPDIIAPGSDILSTFPLSLGKYLIASGTSMATPYLSGVIALYLSAHGGGRKTKGKSELRDIAQSIVSQGRLAPWLDVNQNLDLKSIAPVAQQGGGVIDAYKFVRSTVRFSPNKLALNHTGNLQSKFKITVSNSGAQELKFNVTHQPGVSFYAQPQDPLDLFTHYPTDIIKDKPAVAKLSTSSITVRAGGKATVEIRFTPPTGFVNERVPIYGGHITFINSKNNDVFNVPYSGMAVNGEELWSPKEAGVFFQAQTLEDISSPTKINLTENRIVAEFDVLYGVREALVELVQNSTYTNAAGFTFPRVPGKNGFVGSLAANYAIGRSDAYRPPPRLFPNNKFLNGTAIPAGTYRYVLRVLKPFKEGHNIADWSIHVSPPIEVVF